MNLAVRIVGLAARLLMALGLGCLLLAGWLGWQVLSFASTGVPATGEVVSYLEIDDDGAKRYRPRVRFKTHQGDIISVHGQMAWTSQRYPIGASLPVVYREDKPTEARVAGFTENWLGPLVSVIIAVVALAGGFLVRRSLKRAPPA